mmetsp:Transcript_3804/g.6703  ORF Transcript_3804/g.6703 Transcript_3804/m.6703 type:complete len:186 (-) Transcript_3804:287-844(-)
MLGVMRGCDVGNLGTHREIQQPVHDQRSLPSYQLLAQNPLNVNMCIAQIERELVNRRAFAASFPRPTNIAKKTVARSKYAKRCAPVRKRKTFERSVCISKLKGCHEIRIEAPELYKKPVFKLSTWYTPDKKLILHIKDKIDPLRLDQTFECLPGISHTDLTAHMRTDELVIYIKSPSPGKDTPDC